MLLGMSTLGSHSTGSANASEEVQCQRKVASIILESIKSALLERYPPRRLPSFNFEGWKTALLFSDDVL